MGSRNELDTEKWLEEKWDPGFTGLAILIMAPIVLGLSYQAALMIKACFGS